MRFGLSRKYIAARAEKAGVCGGLFRNFYTDTHYGDDGDPAFVPVKKKDINKTSDIFQAFSIVGAVCGGVYVIYVLAVRKEPASDFCGMRKRRALP